jgi:hypothetical protein
MQSPADYNRDALLPRSLSPQLIALVFVAAGALLLVAQWAGGGPLWLDEEMIAIKFRERTFLRGRMS